MRRKKRVDQEDRINALGVDGGLPCLTCGRPLTADDFDSFHCDLCEKKHNDVMNGLITVEEYEKYIAGFEADKVF